MIILGDAGFNYYGGKRDIKIKEKMARLPITILSIHGNHEMRPGTIPSYHFAEWHGGKVYIEDRYPNLLFAVDGEVYDLDGKNLLSLEERTALTNSTAWQWAGTGGLMNSHPPK